MSRWVDFAAIKRSVDIEQVLEHYGVRLKRVRKDYLRGRCPLPTHDSPQSRESFGAHTGNNAWACHSASCCRARQGRVGGNILDLVAWMEGCSIRQAALRLEEWGHGGLERTGFFDQLVSKGKRTIEGREELPRLPFSLRLSGWHPYLAERGIEPQIAARFGVGYYAGSGFLRGRLVFPMHNQRGELVGYAGRAVEDVEPRYLFPPGFRKSQVVYNLHRAVGLTGEPGRRAIVVEGFFDCLRVHQAGYGNVVALLGASLSDQQAELLEAHFRELVLMLDGDEAGRRASLPIAARLRNRVSLQLVQVPAGRQPDQLARDEIRQLVEG